jgi:hypothetical protein
LDASFFKQSNNGCHEECLSSLLVTIICKDDLSLIFGGPKGILLHPMSIEQPKNNNFFSYGSYHSFWVGSTWPFQVDNKLHVVQAIVEVVAGHMILTTL